MESSEPPGRAPPSRKRRLEKSASPRPAKRHCPRKLALIETLPGEVLESILYYSENIHLTQASPTILKALNDLSSKDSNSNLIYKRFCSRIFRPQNIRMDCDKTRIVNSRFFTWPFFRDLVRDMHSLYLNKRHLTRSYLQMRKSIEFENMASAINWDFRNPTHKRMMDRVKRDCEQASRFPEDLADGSMYTAFTSQMGSDLESLIWKSLDPSTATEVYEVRALLSTKATGNLFNFGVPEKFFRRPFTQDKMAFLVAVFEWWPLSPRKLHLAAQGLLDAIEDNEYLVACLLMNTARIEDSRAMNVLQKAVVDHGCRSEMVSMILKEIFNHDKFCLPSYSPNRIPDKICGHPIKWERQDLLDPKLWKWAEQEKKKGNWKGEWVEINLKRLNRGKKPVSAKTYCEISEKELRLLKMGVWDEKHEDKREEWRMESDRARYDR